MCAPYFVTQDSATRIGRRQLPTCCTQSFVIEPHPITPSSCQWSYTVGILYRKTPNCRPSSCFWFKMLGQDYHRASYRGVRNWILEASSVISLVHQSQGLATIVILVRVRFMTRMSRLWLWGSKVYSPALLL